MVEYARTRLALDCDIAAMDARRNVSPPTVMVMYPARLPVSSGDSFRTMNTPALTMVDECSRADVGVGATIAPSSHVWNGICADLTIPARHRSMTATRIHWASESEASRLWRSRNPYWCARTMFAARNAIPPIRFRINCLNELLTASVVLVYPIRAKEHSVVISQKKNIHTRSLDSTMPYIALRNV